MEWLKTMAGIEIPEGLFLDGTLIGVGSKSWDILERLMIWRICWLGIAAKASWDAVDTIL